MRIVLGIVVLLVELLTDGVTPVCKERRTWKCAVHKQDHPFNPIKRGGGIDKLEVVFTDDACVRNHASVVGAQTVIAPTRSVAGRVDTPLDDRVVIEGDMRICKGGTEHGHEARGQQKMREMHLELELKKTVV